MVEHFYFGCFEETGHHLYNPQGRKLLSHSVYLPNDFPCRSCMLDGGFLPPNLPQTEGRATFTHLNGWTIISFWDRSIDDRGGSSSTFLIRGVFAFDMAKALSKETFPSIWKRFTFEVKEPSCPK